MSLLWECFENLEDPRKASGRRYKLSSIMKMLVTGLLSGRRSLAQIVVWARSLSPKAQQALGFTKAVPCTATLSKLLRRIDPEMMERTLRRFTLKGKELLNPGEHLALDGKSLRASAQDTVPMVHLLSAFVTRIRGIMGQVKLEEGENEITASLRFLEELPIDGAIITGDAMFAQKKSVL